jgi:hypothetical protein
VQDEKFVGVLKISFTKLIIVSCQCLCRVVHTLSHNFRNATRLERVRLRLPVEPHSALVKIIYAGVNASDVSCCT